MTNFTLSSLLFLIILSPFGLAGQLYIRYYSFMLIYFAIGIALIVPVLFLYLLDKFDLFQTGKNYTNIITLVCGGFAYYLAAQINPAMLNAGWVTRSQVIQITAPILEEILKSLILIFLVTRADFNYVVDGAIYGFGAGIGFAMIENVQYITDNPEIALSLAIARVFSTNLVHATASGMIGTALAYHRGDKNVLTVWIVIITGYLLAISTHMGFNTMVSGGTFLIFAIIFGFIGVGLIWYVIRMGLTIQKHWVSEKLGMVDRVTKEEMMVVSNINTINEILAPVENRFGVQKASLVKSLVYMQAEIGIKRKLIEVASSENKKAEINEIITGLNKDVDKLRKEIGPYCMMMVRTVYMESNLQIWNLLNSRIAESSTGQKGGGLWDRANQRMKPSPAQEEEKS